MPDAAGNHFGPLDVVASPDAEDYTESTWYRFAKRSGVLSGGTVTFDGRTVTMAPVEAHVAGGFFYRDAPFLVASPPTTGANPRRDMLVLRSTLTSGSGSSAVPGKTVPVLIQGAPAGAPVDPAPGARDEPIASWMVPGGGGSGLTAGRDLRRYGGDTLWVPSMAQRPTGDRIIGTRIRPADAPGLHFTWTGRVWAQDGVLAASALGSPVGSYVRRFEDTSVVAVNKAGNGSFTVTLPAAFSAAPVEVTMGVGDYGGGQAVTMVPLGSNHEADKIVGFALLANGTVVGNDTNVRVNWSAVGYNT